MAQSDKKHLAIGKKGEDVACNYLKYKGFSVVERNYWKPWGEIDIVAKKGGAHHFVEVKTVSRDKLPDMVGADGNSFGAGDFEPMDNVHRAKRQRLWRVIETYLVERQLNEDSEWYVDVVAVYLNKEGGLLAVDFLEDIQRN